MAIVMPTPFLKKIKIINNTESFVICRFESVSQRGESHAINSCAYARCRSGTVNDVDDRIESNTMHNLLFVFFFLKKLLYV